MESSLYTALNRSPTWNDFLSKKMFWENVFAVKKMEYKMFPSYHCVHGTLCLAHVLNAYA